MKSLQTKINQPYKQHGYRFWLSWLLLLFGLPLFYYGYCWGLWGRHSLLLQYLLQCGCPASSDNRRYPTQVEVIVPACHYVNSRLLPSGRFLYVEKKRLGRSSTYLLDLQTNEKVTIATPEGPFFFLTESLLYVSAGERYIFDWTNNKQVPIQKFVYLYPDAYVDGNTNLKLLVKVLQGAKNIFFIKDNDTVVALTSDSLNNPEQNFVIDRFDIPGLDTDRMQRFLSENNIIYQSIPANFPGTAVSPNGRLIALPDGIHLIETNQLIVKAYPSQVRGWTSDGLGVIYSSSGPCLIQTNFGILDDAVCFFEVHQPVLRLKVPKEYVLP